MKVAIVLLEVLEMRFRREEAMKVAVVLLEGSENALLKRRK